MYLKQDHKILSNRGEIIWGIKDHSFVSKVIFNV